MRNRCPEQGILTPGEGAHREVARKGSPPRDMASPTFAWWNVLTGLRTMGQVWQ